MSGIINNLIDGIRELPDEDPNVPQGVKDWRKDQKEEAKDAYQEDSHYEPLED